MKNSEHLVDSEIKAMLVPGSDMSCTMENYQFSRDNQRPISTNEISERYAVEVNA